LDARAGGCGVQAQKQQQVNLAHEIPVLILYGTAIANEDGQVFFFEDNLLV